jgi:heme/copper-type cytochrome/quinol oxidase subunit 2
MLHPVGNLSPAGMFLPLGIPYNQIMRRLLLALFVVAAAHAYAQEPAQNRRDFTIIAKDHAFTPNTLDVTQDDLVKITLTSEDVPASFAIDAYRIIKRVAGHSSVTFEFRADQAGTFPFYCNLTKDAGCKDMTGTLNVRPK